ncbi:hypothetical protein DFH06DRAFT_1208800 [Mycena polygramma]|nr:hypothetical protein DFH06DRAFT_1208800 [Mycena polygramma]
MVFSQNPADASYRRKLGETGLVLRWSTAADKAGCILVSCLAWGQQEGEEDDLGARYIEPYMDDAFYSGSSENWAVCVDTSPTEIKAARSDSETYVDQIRAEAESAPERIVALVYFLPQEISFDGDAVCLPTGKAHIVACKAAYRQRGDGENIVKALFDMVNARALATGRTLMTVAGIPAYYRTHGYEYALNVGHGLATHVSSLRPPVSADPSPFLLRLATLADLPCLERLVTAPRPTADIFVGVSAPTLHAQLRWILGDRPASCAVPTYPVNPFFVLEKRENSHIVAAAGLLNRGTASVTVHPLLWDGVENASAVTVTLVRQLIETLDAQSEDFSTRLTTIRWVIADAHPLRRWLLAHELAVPAPPSSRYDYLSVWWAAIPSFPAFLAALAPALTARVARAVHVLGQNYEAAVHIAAPRAFGGGVLLRVANGNVSVSAPSSGSKPTLSLPHGALIQLLLGYRSWEELKAAFPDVSVEPALVPLVEVLFPRRVGIGSTMLGVHHSIGDRLSFK